MARTRILVVDDHPDTRVSLKQLLELLGYEVETARDGAAALKAHRARHAGVVITDILMAGMEGIETIKSFKADWPHVRVIAMSAGAYLQAALHVGADAAVQKPFTVRTLLGALSPNEVID